jgi:sugar phosphate isomerase/epimerase
MTAKISVGTSAFTMGAYAQKPVPFEKVVARLAELGYDGLELPANKGYGSLEDWPDTASRKELTKLVRGAGLEISSYGADLSPSPYYSSDRLDCEIEVIRVDTLSEPPGPPGVSYEDAWRRTVETFRAYAEYAQRRGIVVAWEFEPGFMLNKPGEIVGLVEEVDHPNFTVMFDFCHAHMCAAVGARQPPPAETLPGGAVELGGQLQGHIGFVHLIDSDNSLHDGITSTHAPFGTGVLDVPQLVQTMLEAGYQNPWWTIDLCFWPEAWDELEPSLNFVRNLLKDFDLL